MIYCLLNGDCIDSLFLFVTQPHSDKEQDSNLLIMAVASLPSQSTSSIDWKWNSGQQQKASVFVLLSCCMIKMDRRKKSAGRSWPSMLLISLEDRKTFPQIRAAARPDVAVCQTLEYL